MGGRDDGLAVDVSGLVKRYGRVTAVDGLDLRVGVGDVFGFLGPNGAGKTTTLRALLGLIRPDAGTVRLFGREVASGAASQRASRASLRHRASTPTVGRDQLAPCGGVRRHRAEPGRASTGAGPG